MSALQTWLPIVIAALLLIAGGGWLQYILSRRREERERWRSLLSEFLRPLEAKLRETDFIFHELTASGELGRLEYSPGRLRYEFMTLPDGNPTKAVWQLRIDRLQKLNKNAVELIDRYYGQIQLESFRKACDEFKNHAAAWEDLWNSVKDKRQAATSRDEGRLQSDPFPGTLEPALQKEVDLVASRAGSR